MKNSTLFPFERNKYFYGKLLSVDDFELEQKYFNDKRRVINRYLSGTGVVAGMFVVMVDEQSVSVETGFALDAFGREIVIDAPVLKKLSLIEGFSDCENAGGSYCYLCVDYNEQDIAPVHNIAGKFDTEGSSNEGKNRIKEGFRLFLTSREPEEINLSANALFEETVRIYSSDGVTIDQTMSRFVRCDEEVELKIEIENLGQQYISFSYDCDLTCLTYNGSSKLNVSFDEMLFEKSGRYSMTFKLRAADAVGVSGYATPNGDDFRLFASKQPVKGSSKPEGKSTIQLTDRDAMDEVIEDYYRSAMENRLKNNDRESIYLARIHMIKAGDTYIIESIENSPFGQRVMSAQLNSALTSMLIAELKKYDKSADGGGDNALISAGGRAAPRIAGGSVEFDLSRGGMRGQRFFSSEIFHGVGLGNVSVTIGISERDDETYYGAGNVFEQRTIPVDSAVCTYREKGSFVIGIILLDNITGGKLTVQWTAVRSTDEEREDMVEKKVFIKPGILDIATRESYYLDAVCQNMTDKRLNWSVADNGGSIDSNGCYTAPNIPGVYEVTAQSAAWPEVKATIFIVVREKDE